MKKRRVIMLLAMMLMLLCTSALALSGAIDNCPEGSDSGVGHWYDLWHTQQDGTHWSACLREECGHEKKNVPCTEYTFTYGGTTYTVCPVCGEFDGGHFVFTTGRTLGSGMPNGERIIRSMLNPCGENADVLAAYTVACEQLGKVTELNTTAMISCKCIVDGEFTLVRADGETLTEIDCTAADGQMHFTTDKPGVFLLLAR